MRNRSQYTYTALLIPLADLLGTTVTKFLMCERMNSSNTVDVGQVENIVKTAISFSDDMLRAYHTKTHWIIMYVMALIISIVGMVFNHLKGQLSEPLITTTLLSAIFGAYICCFAKVRLPAAMMKTVSATFVMEFTNAHSRTRI